MTDVELRAVADALEQWPETDDAVGYATDGQHHVLCRARLVDGVFVIDEPVTL